MIVDKQQRVAAVYLGAVQPADLRPVLTGFPRNVTNIASDGLSGTVTDGPLLVAAGVAALVGLVGFLSPCVLPLVPGYLSYVAGLTGTDERHPQRRMVGGAVLFVLGFTVIFVAEGVLFGSLGAAIRDHTVLIERILGVVTIVMGLVFLGRFSFLQREVRIHRLPPRALSARRCSAPRSDWPGARA